MKTYFLLLVSVLYSFTAPAQRLTPVQSGTSLGAVLRDLAQFPTTDQGKAALVAALNSGSLAVGARPADAAIVGKFSYLFSDSRRDFTNQAMVSDAAPVLLDAPRSAPRLLGNYYDFPVQTALNTWLFKRFPAFQPHTSKIIIYPGGLSSDTTDNNGMLSRGWTHTSEAAWWGNYQTYPTNLRRALEMANYAAAYNAAQRLPDSDYRKQKLLDWAGPLPAFEGTHLFIDDEETCKLYAAEWYNVFKQADWKGAGVDYFSVNHEVFVPRPNSPYDYVGQWYHQVGWITKEIIRLANAEGKDLKSGMTDWANLCHLGTYFFDDNDPATGFPHYMSYGYIMEPYRGTSQSAPMGTPSDLGQLVKDGKAFVGVGSYIQHTFDEQSLFEKNSNGSYKIGADGGLVWRTDTRTSIVSGQPTLLYKDDPYKSTLKFYNIFARYATNQYFRAGGIHLPLSTDRQAGFEKVRFISQFRLDTEVEGSNTPSGLGLTQDQFNTLNSRALNPDWTEAMAIGMYLYSDYIRGWMDTQQKSTLGSNSNGNINRASVEQYTKGFHRASQLNWIFDTPWRMVQPHLWMKNAGMVSTASAEEQFYRKPILMGGLATKDNKLTLWLYGWWPCQDTDRYTDVLVWVDKGAGAVSPAYRVRLKGRKAFLDYWTLPDAVAGVAPKDLYFQFSTLLGEKVTWRGDYREARITAHPTPPAVQENGLGFSANTAFTTSGTASTLALKTGYAYQAAPATYTVYANRTDTETYRAKLTAVDGQTNPAGSLSAMEVGSFTDPSGRGWNLRRVISPVTTGRWQQTVEKQSTGATVSANVSLATANSDATLTTVSSATVASNASTLGLLARYSYSLDHTGTLQIRGKGTGNFTLKIERQDGQPIAMANGQNSSLSSGVFYGYGTATDDYPLDWTFWNVPQVPLVVTINLNGATNTVVITPTVAANIDLFGSDASPPLNASTIGLLTRYTYSLDHAGTLQVRGKGTGPYTLKVERVDGQSIAMANGQNTSLSSGTFYSYGTVSDDYNLDWTFWNVPQAPLRLTFQLNGTTNQVTLTPVTGTADLYGSISTPTSTTVVTGTTTTATHYDKIFVVGNSITEYWQTSEISFGYNASVAAKDWLHLFKGYYQTLNPSVDIRTFSSFAGSAVPAAPAPQNALALNKADGPHWEQNYWRIGTDYDQYYQYWNPNFTRFKAIQDWKPDCIIIRIGENVTDASHNLRSSLVGLINYLKAQNPSARVIVTNAFWNGREQYDSESSGATSDVGGTPVTLDKVSPATSDPNTTDHPNDTGMLMIAGRVFDAAKTTTTTTTTTGSGGGSSDLVGKPTSDTYSYPTITGMTGWPQYDSRTVTYQPSGVTRAIGEKATLDNGQIHVEVWKNYGCSIAHVSKSGTNNNLINQNKDLGRGVSETDYLGGTVIQNAPFDNSRLGPWGNGQPDGIGGASVALDPIQIGDYFNNPSKVIAFSTDGKTIYTKIQKVNWNVNNDLTDVIQEQWVTLDGRAAKVRTRTTANRPQEKQQYTARSNERPNFYAVGRLAYLAYIDNNGQVQYKTNGPGTPFTIGERWVAAVEHAGNTADEGIGLTRSGFYSTVQSTEPGGDSEFENGTNHSNAEMHIQWDWNSVLYNQYDLVVGTVDQIRSYALAQPDPYNKIAWKFNSRNGRGRFWTENLYDSGTPTPNSGNVYTPKKNSDQVFYWPDINVDPTTVNTITIRYTLTSNATTNHILCFGSPGQDASTVRSHEVPFSLIADNQPHTATINVRNNPHWLDGKISTLYLITNNLPTDSHLTIQWINTNQDADPEP